MNEILMLQDDETALHKAAMGGYADDIRNKVYTIHVIIVAGSE